MKNFNSFFNSLVAMPKRLAMVLTVLFTLGVGSMWGETKTEGFEKATSDTNYQGTVNLQTSDSDCGISWQIYYGCVSTSSKISGNNSAALRLYTSNYYGYLKTTMPIDGLSKVTFKAKASTSNSAKIKVNISYSKDGEAWEIIASDVEYGTSSASVSYDIPSGGKYFQIAISSNSTKPTKNNAQLTIDDIVFTYTIAPSYTVTVTSNNNEFGSVSLNGTTITATPETGYRVSTTNPYSISPSGSATVAQDGNTFTVTPSANTTITINFEAIPTYTVNWHVNGTVEHTQTGTAGTTLTNIPQPIKSDCDNSKVFVGWVTSGINEPTNIKPDFVTPTTIPSSNTDYYAVFATSSNDEGNGAEEVFYVNEGSEGTDQTTAIVASGNINTKNGNGDSGNCIGLTSAATKTFTFSNINTSNYSTVSLQFDHKIGKYTNYPTLTISCGDFVKTIQGSTGKYITVLYNDFPIGKNLTLTFTISAASGNNYSQTYLDNISLIGYKATTTYSNYTTQCTTQTSVTLNPNGGTISANGWKLSGNNYTQTVETTNDVALPTPQKTGYTFGGWYESSTFSGSAVTVIEAGTTGTKEFWAKWTPTTYTITYDNLGGASNTNPTEYNIESETINFVDPGTRDGYIFKGWEPASLAKGSIGNQIVTAKWCEILGDATGLSVQTDYVEDGLTYVKFSWTPADNTKSHASKQVICIGKVGEEKKCTDLEENQIWTADLRSKLSPGEYEWTIQAIGDGTDYCDGEVIAGANFTIIGYVISFDTDGGDGEYNDVTIFEGETYTVPAAPTKANYTFKAWSDGTNLYQPGDVISNLTEDLTLTAIWRLTTSLSWSVATCTATIASPSNVFPELTTTPADLQGVQYSSSEPTVATIDANGNIRLLTAGETTITANFVENATHAASSAEYTLTVVASDNCKWVETDINDIDPYDEVVVTMGNETVGYALGTEKITNSPKSQEITIQNGVISENQVFDYASYSWNISSENGGYILRPNGVQDKYLRGLSSYITIGSDATNNVFYIFTNTENDNQCFFYTIGEKVYYLGYGIEDEQRAWKQLTSYKSLLASNTLKFYKKTCLPANKFWIDYELANVTYTNTPPPFAN